MKEKMRVAVMGAGAVGGYLSARLAASGHDVSFIARGRHLEAMRAGGLKVGSLHGDLHIRSLFTSEPAQIGLVDLVLFWVKSYSTEEAAKQLAPLIGKERSFFFCRTVLIAQIKSQGSGPNWRCLYRATDFDSEKKSHGPEAEVE
jgi:2-dehydropantoate 2-reductase